jgi:hypothetical protein
MTAADQRHVRQLHAFRAAVNAAGGIRYGAEDHNDATARRLGFSDRFAMYARLAELEGSGEDRII